ncbi:MAG: hypothetical protein AAGA77_03985 [Bacteroidota bacterium]
MPEIDLEYIFSALPIGGNLPNAPIRDIDINYTSQTVKVGTFGWGIWESDLYGAGCAAYPMAVCKVVDLKLNKQGLAIDFVEMLDGGSYDYCGIDTMYSISEVLTCEEAMEGMVIILFVEDDLGNKDSCMIDASVISGNNPNNTRFWFGSVNTFWFNECNWEYGGLPEIDETVTIPSGHVVNIGENAIAQVKSLTVKESSKIRIHELGSLNVEQYQFLGLYNFD